MAYEILGHDTNNGSWAGHGTGGYWYPDAALSAYRVLPAGMTSFSGPTDGSGSYSDTDRCMSLPTPPGGRALAYRNTDTRHLICIVGTTVPVVVSIRLNASASHGTSTVTILSPTSVVLAGPVTVGDPYLGIWVRVRVDGDCSIEVDGLYPRWQGALFDLVGAASAPGRLACVRPGRFGLIG